MTPITASDFGPARGSRRLRRSWRGIIAISAVAFILILHGSWLDEPFDLSMGGKTSSEYYAYSCEAFDEHGFTNLGMRPALFFQRDTDTTFAAYLNHPFTPYVIVYPCYRWLGRDERALRLPILALALATLLGVWGAGRRSGRSVAAIASALLATSPWFIQYGNMVDAPMFSVALLAPGAFSWVRWRRRPTAGRAAAWFGFCLAGALIDWFGFFLLPLFWVDLILARSGGSRPWRTALVAATPFVLGGLAYVAWLLMVTESIDDVIEQLRQLLGIGGRGSRTGSTGENALARISGHVVDGFSPIVLALAALGAARAGWRSLAGRPARIDRPALMLTVAGLLPAVVFYKRATDHDFWVLPAGPGIALLAASGVLASRRALHVILFHRRRLADVVFAALLVTLLVSRVDAGLDLHDQFRSSEFRDRTRDINAFTDRRDVILTPPGAGCSLFGAEGSLMIHVDGDVTFRKVLERLEPGRESIGRLLLCAPTTMLTDLLWARDVPRISSWEEPYGVGIMAVVELNIDAAFALLQNR